MRTAGGSEELLKRIGGAIAAARKRAGLTQSVVANAVGVEIQTISRLETGTISPTVHRLSQFAELFDCPIGSLFGEHRAAAGEDARSLSLLIADLPREDRRVILRIVSDAASLARAKDERQYREAAIERRELLEATGGDKGKKRRAKRL
ncbi:helix-turn-helix transcriptional regulator [Caballeronia sp. GAFFF2]|uniref:helix-turn-helix domain-containing protein n=1 Tax=Caballeronia sp. GAFFF2 TaxID=2921741 RepID=UPI002541E4B0|nr:helix-turn-helix transcriptional regulator [Caballeronia sp. GAFFF2]